MTYRGEYHKVDETFGPFDLFECRNCGSLGTATPPSKERLAQFYQDYDSVRPDWYNQASADGALEAQYRFYANFLKRSIAPNQSWLDVGAGHGEVANIVSTTRNGGTAIDIGDRPPTLSHAVDYKSIDMNADEWAKHVGRKFDLVYAVAVWEHVLSPASFAQQCLSLVSEGGRLVLICPDYGSIARKVLKKSWPYFEPGEHLTIPTRRGAKRALNSASKSLGIEGARIGARNLNVGYSLRYLLTVLRFRQTATLLPPSLALPLPTGLLAAIVSVPQK